MGTLSVIGIFWLFLRARPEVPAPKRVALTTSRDLFTQVIQTASPKILQLWEEGDRFVAKGKLNCPQEIISDPQIGRSYYQCQPHLWQCYWESMASEKGLEIELFGQTFHVFAQASFSPIPVYSELPRYYQMFKNQGQEFAQSYGYIVELGIREFPGLSQPLILTDTCRDTYLPERIYGQGRVKDQRQEGFIWDNFGRAIFIDKFYVTNQQVNEWRVLTGETQKIQIDRKLWPRPALLSLTEQENYCAFFGKRVLEAKLFDAATMSPSDLKNPLPSKVYRPSTPWQRDLSRSFLGMARINPDYQLTPLDCQLAQVQGCSEKYFTTDSATWMGMHFALGFYPESLKNSSEPNKNLKLSSRFLAPDSEWHELGVLSSWNGEQSKTLPVAFRCYEEVSP